MYEIIFIIKISVLWKKNNLVRFEKIIHYGTKSPYSTFKL
jgi:hypothetical protein